MSILQEILEWSQALPLWQQHAISLLYADRSLSANELDDVLALAKSLHGIPDAEARVPMVLAAAQVAAPPVPNRLVRIVAIKGLKDVNALSNGEHLPISVNGLTVIYGENGSGKSGYARLLKQSCRARDQAEPILPDARKPRDASGPACATFEVIVDGTSVDLNWTNGTEAPEQLSEISIFDAHCARAYVDNQGDFAYAPYGLDILEGLVNVCTAVRGAASKELELHTPNLEPFRNLSLTNTKVGRLLSSISWKTDPADVELLATLTDAAKERLGTLNRTLAESDPRQKAKILRLRAIRFGNLARRIESATKLVNDEKLAEFRSLFNRVRATAEAATLAAKQFEQNPGLLVGTGGDEWKVLFEAARAFAAVSHSAHSFPFLPPESGCPLCQNALGEVGSARLAEFNSFIQQQAEKAAKSARAAATVSCRDLTEASLHLAIDEALDRELRDSNPEIADACARMQSALSARQASVMRAASEAIGLEAIDGLPSDPCETLCSLAGALEAEAKALDDSMDETAKAAMEAEQAELDAQRRLGEIKGSVLDAIEKLAISKKLKACIDSISTTGISRKSTELSKTMATQEVANALNEELLGLNVHELQVVMKPESPGGKAQFKLTLQLPGGGTPTEILSEGEQRAIAIASFLAEVKLGRGLGGIVFDDPVSSLDHRRRWAVARRLAFEATHRQVIVFTHDIYFLCILQKEAERVGSLVMTQCIRRTASGFGVPAGRLPFDALGTKSRVTALRNLSDEVAKLHKAGEEEAARKLTREAYFQLRLGWERAVEEVLLNSVIQRFDEGVSTKRLSGVVVEDADYVEIDAGMTKCSKFVHDPALSALLPTPHPTELRADIDRLEVWRDLVEKRKRTIAESRK